MPGPCQRSRAFRGCGINHCRRDDTSGKSSVYSYTQASVTGRGSAFFFDRSCKQVLPDNKEEFHFVLGPTHPDVCVPPAHPPQTFPKSPGSWLIHAKQGPLPIFLKSAPLSLRRTRREHDP